MRYAFYGRVSTEDQQDPETSRNWQLERARALTDPHGQIVAEFFDIGQSRSLPWKRRPRASALLDLLKQPDREFEAVVIGEPQRAFYGNQYGLTFPVFVHYGVGLWVPEVGGPIDPESEAHDLVMSVFGGMSKGERNRIKIRVRSAMAAQAKLEGRYLGGRPPYGYRLADAGPHPNPGKAAEGRRLHRLEPDPAAAPVVQRIFTAYLAGQGMYSLAEDLTRDGIPCPPPTTPRATRTAAAPPGPKAPSAPSSPTPATPATRVWNRQRKDERLLDVDNVALGHTTKLVWNNPDAWISSTDPPTSPSSTPTPTPRHKPCWAPAASNAPPATAAAYNAPTYSAGSCTAASANAACKANTPATSPTTAAASPPNTASPTQSPTPATSTSPNATSCPPSTTG